MVLVIDASVMKFISEEESNKTLAGTNEPQLSATKTTEVGIILKDWLINETARDDDLVSGLKSDEICVVHNAFLWLFLKKLM